MKKINGFNTLLYIYGFLPSFERTGARPQHLIFLIKLSGDGAHYGVPRDSTLAAEYDVSTVSYPGIQDVLKTVEAKNEEEYTMPEGKYGKYFFEKPIVEGKFAPRLIFFSSKYVGEKDFSLLWNCVTEPFLMAEEPHSHDFDQFLHFYGANSLNITDFDAEVDLSLGKEGEKHIITEPTVVHIPKGLIHCPLYFRVVNKPVIFMNVALTPQYMKPKP